MMRNESRPRAVLVSGPTRGIGKAIVTRLAGDASIQLVLLARKGLPQLVDELLTHEPGMHPPVLIECDIADGDQIRQAATLLEDRLGHLDVLINNAGITIDGAFSLLASDDIGRVLRTNLIGTMRLTLNMLPLLLSGQNPAVVNISSLAAVSGKEGQGAYSASKGGVLGFSKLLAGCLGSQQLVVNNIAPGFVKTEMVTGLAASAYSHILEGTPLGRMGDVTEVAELCHFLAKTSCRYLNSTTLRLDGGFHR